MIIMSKMPMRLSRFAIWAGLGLIFPVTIGAFLATFYRSVPYWAEGPPRPWQATLVEWLIYAHAAYLIAGIALFRGWRRAALAVGLAQGLLSGWVGLHAVMSITGAWL